MTKFTIAAAQSSSYSGDYERNIAEHLRFINVAAEINVDVIIFPELSLTGYERKLAEILAISKENEILSPLHDISKKLNISIIAGCPILSNSSKPFIGAFIFPPDRPIIEYRKRYLHTGEEQYFIPSEDNLVYLCKKEFVGIAICADINNPQHPSDSKKVGATIYAAGVCMTPGGINEASTNMSKYAAQHSVLTVMANYATETGGYASAGKSAIWGYSGEYLAEADEFGNALVLATKINKKWTGKTIKI